MIVVFLGPPGAGKGTQASRLSAKYGLPRVSTGDMLRDAVAAGSELGNEVKAIMDAGQLVDDVTMARLVHDRLSQPDTRSGAILDGYPRTLGQAAALDRLLSDSGKDGVDLVLLLEVPEEMLVDRLSRRRACPDCGANYHLTFKPPARESTCDRCGGALMQRDDDREDVVRGRLRVYADQTEPLVTHYEAEGRLHHVDATGEMGTVFGRIDAAMSEAVRA